MNNKSFLLGISAKYKVICRKGKKNLKYIQNINRKLITILKYISAEKVVLPPLIIIKRGNYYIRIYIRSQKGFR